MGYPLFRISCGLVPKALCHSDFMDGEAVECMGVSKTRGAAFLMKEYLEYLNRGDFGKLMSWGTGWEQTQSENRIQNLITIPGRACDRNSCYDRIAPWGSYREGKFFPKKYGAWIQILNILREEAMIEEEQKCELQRWLLRYPSHHPYIENNIEWLEFPEKGGGKNLKACPYALKAALSMGMEERREFPAFETPMLMNLELTTRCPLRCPQCYCSLEGGKDLPLETAKYWIDEAAVNRVQQINLSGGETMCYPHLFPLMDYIAERGMKCNVALSGYGFDKAVLEKMCQSGVNTICISLNGPTEEINQWSRDGFSLAVDALALLREAHFPGTEINWVMHRTNADSFPQMVALAEEYGVRGLVVMVFKPDAENQRNSIPSKEQMRKTADFIRNYKGPVELEAEDCFSQMRALLGQRFFGNRNRGLGRGCGAGSDGVSVTVDGRLTPCRHLEVPEDCDSLKAYWEQSPFLSDIRKAQEHKKEPCAGCRYERYCLPCLAVNWKQKKELSFGEENCPLREREEIKE